jgi:hypothetical protein
VTVSAVAGGGGSNSADLSVKRRSHGKPTRQKQLTTKSSPQTAKAKGMQVHTFGDGKIEGESNGM